MNPMSRYDENVCGKWRQMYQRWSLNVRENVDGGQQVHDQSSMTLMKLRINVMVNLQTVQKAGSVMDYNISMFVKEFYPPESSFLGDIVLCWWFLYIPFRHTGYEWLLLFMIRKIRGNNRRSLLFLDTYSHTWVFFNGRCCRECDIYFWCCYVYLT